MRLDNFEVPPDAKPLGEGGERRVFVDPANEKRVIAETKSEQQETVQKLKGRFYLTKIVHLLLPENIPDMYQAGESKEGTQTIDRERVSHTPGHAALQKAFQREGYDKEKDDDPAVQQLKEELGKGLGDIADKLSDLGLAFSIDVELQNYTKDEKGNVQYLEAFNPWEVDVVDPNKLEVLFDEEGLREAIGKLPDEGAKKECTSYLERLLILMKEDEQELQEKNRMAKENREECGPFVAEVKAWLTPFTGEETLATLNAIETEKEADNSTERALAKKALISVCKQLEFLKGSTNITPEAYDELEQQYKILYRAVGIQRRKDGMEGEIIIDHTGAR